MVSARAGAAEVAEPTDIPLPRIVNGLTTSDFPTVGALLDGGNPLTASTLCSGTMIGCETFLTAGHCVVDDLNPSHYTVFLQHAGFFSVAAIHLHPAYDFPDADVAVLRLTTPLTGIRATPIDTAGGHSNGTPGTIAGFGRSGGSAFDYGLKRYGAVSLANCGPGISNLNSICWDFDSPVGPAGTDSNTCNADSGGPLFLDVSGTEVVAGITSGGDSATCLANDQSFDARVSTYTSFIQLHGGADLANTSCGSVAQVGDPDVDVFAFDGGLGLGNPQALHSFTVGPGVPVLRVAANGNDDGFSDFDLYVRFGAPPTTSTFDCASVGQSQYGYCELTSPAAGTWYVLMDRFAGSGAYQVTATALGSFCSNPGNDGQPCDDDNSCTGGETCQAGTCVGSPVGNGTPCDDDDACTPSDTCQTGVCVGQSSCGDGVVQAGCEECDDGGIATGDGCDASCAVETCYACSGVPSSCGPPPACRVAGKGVLIVKGDPDPTRDRILARWQRGDTNLAEFGTPPTTTSYTLCLRDDGALVSAATVAAAGTCGSSSCWQSLGTRGFKYRNKSGNDDGVYQLLLKSGTGNAKLLWKARGAKLSLPGPAGPQRYFNQTSSVSLQIVNEADGACWQADFPNARTNSATQFKAVTP
jgi:cysteine-rich repeat protein